MIGGPPAVRHLLERTTPGPPPAPEIAAVDHRLGARRNPTDTVSVSISSLPQGRDEDAEKRDRDARRREYTKDLEKQMLERKVLSHPAALELLSEVSHPSSRTAPFADP